jgi:hypothetical protein
MIACHAPHHLAIIMLMSIGVGACGRAAPLVPVTGRVVFPDQAPVTFGTIEFIPRSNGPPARGAIDPQGHFTLRTAGREGARSGEYRVVVVQLAVAEGVKPHIHQETHDTPRRVSPRHAEAGQSELSATVTPDAPNELVITVTPLNSVPSR